MIVWLKDLRAEVVARLLAASVMTPRCCRCDVRSWKYLPLVALTAVRKGDGNLRKRHIDRVMAILGIFMRGDEEGIKEEI